MKAPLLLALGLACALSPACSRNMAPFDPNEKPRQPEISKIFPPGAEEAMKRSQPGRGPMQARSAAPPGAPAAPIQGTVRLAASLESRVPAGAVLFLIARRGASGPPLAVKRLRSPHFPLSFEIGPGDRMIQAMPFSGPIRLTARIDADGNATSRSPGDLQGSAPAPVQPGATGVEIRIDQVLGEARAPARRSEGASGGAAIRGTIRLAPALRDRVPAGAVLFLVARRGSAGPPLAVKRIANPRFPLSFEIGPGNEMIPGTPFAGPVHLSARLDSDHDAITHSPGDLQGATAQPVEPGASGVTLLLDQVL